VGGRTSIPHCSTLLATSHGAILSVFPTCVPARGGSCFERCISRNIQHWASAVLPFGNCPRVGMNQIKTAPVAASVTTGLIASLCCGGSLIFASIGLGTFWSVLGLSRYVPHALAAGALCIVAINYVSYRRAAERVCRTDGGGLVELRRSMFLSACFGLPRWQLVLSSSNG
jgi:hypothetical protein